MDRDIKATHVPRFQQYTKNWAKKEIPVQRTKRARHILTQLQNKYPKAAIALHYKTPWQLLVAVVLSAQCTDKKVNEVTRILFQKYKTVKDFARADISSIEKIIRPTGFYHTKARHIIHAAQKIEKEFGGKLPRTMEQMITLPGVGRKSANIILGNTYGIIDGVAVDTHVSRISQRLGFTHETTPEKIEQDLMKLFPKRVWLSLTYFTIEHGRTLCKARNRKCGTCPLKNICPSSLV